MNNYITNKLKEFDDKYDEELVEIIKDVLSATKDSVHIHNFVRERISDALTDYHNHIVELLDTVKIKADDGEKQDLADALTTMFHHKVKPAILSLLQDTNPKE